MSGSGNAARTIEGVPILQWGKSGECTFAGALAAATSVTVHPCDYIEIMGVTGLAFRTRWFQGPDPRWCPSSPVGESGEEIEAARNATGWKMRDIWEWDSSLERYAPQIVASIDAGLPVVSYGTDLNCSVIFGYEDGGRRVLLRDYLCRDGTLALATRELRAFLLFLEESAEPLSHRSAARQGLEIAVRNFSRRHDPADNEARGYWHGPHALARWAEDIDKADTLTEEERGKLFFVNWWNYDSLADARGAAVTFLKRAGEQVGGDVQTALDTAAGIYAREAALLTDPFRKSDAFLGPWTGKTLADWTAAVRQREERILCEARAIEIDAIAALADASAALRW